MEIPLTGPYSWLKLETRNDMPTVPDHPGIYLWAVDYMDGHLIYGVGIKRRPIPVRLKEHTIKYMNGDYNVLDIESMRPGERGHELFIQRQVGKDSNQTA